MTYSIRPMTLEDLGQVNDIDREAFPTQWPQPNYRQELNNKLAHYIVAGDDSRTMEVTESPKWWRKSGLLSMLMPWSKRTPSDDTQVSPVIQQYIVGFSGIWVLVDEAHITNIALRTKYQGRGLGELLLIATIDLALEHKATMMTLEVRASNQVAQNLYNKYGFVQVGIRKGYYLDNREDAVIMSTESITVPSFQVELKRLREALSEKLGDQEPTT